MESVKVDRGKNVVKADPNQVEATEKFRFSLRVFSRYAELFCHCRKVLLKDLGGNYASPLTAALLDDLESSGLLLRRVSVVGIDEDIGI